MLHCYMNGGEDEYDSVVCNTVFAVPYLPEGNGGR